MSVVGINESKVDRAIRIVGGSFTVLLGILVVLGRLGGVDLLQWVTPDLSPVPFNTGVCFVLIGVSLLNINSLRLYRFLCALVLIIAGVTLISDFFNLDLLLDNLNTNPQMTPENSHPGRMGSNTAICFYLVSISLFLGKSRRKKPVISASAVLAGATVLIGFVALVGYFQDYETAYGWGSMTRMNVHTAIGFIIIGITICVYFWKAHRDEDEFVPSWFGVLVLVMGFTVTILTYQAVLDFELGRVRELTENAANHLRDIIQTKVESRGNAIERMARRWVISQSVVGSNWYDDVAQHLEDFPGFEAIGKTDRSGKITLIKKSKKVGYKHASYLREISDESMFMEYNGTPSISFRITNAFFVKDNLIALAIVAPLFYNDTYDGLVFAIFNVTKLFEAVVDKNDVLPNFNFFVFDGESQIYGRDTEVSSSHGETVSVARKVDVGEHEWTLFVSPKDSFLNNRKLSLAFQVLSGGLVASVLLSVLVFLMRLAHMKSRDAQRLSNRLRAILDGSTRVSIVVTDLDGTISLFNSGAEQMLGYKSEELVGKKSSLIFHLDNELVVHGKEMFESTGQDTNAFAALTDAARRGKFEEKNWTYVRKDGSQLPVNLIVTAIREDEEIVGFLEIAVDVTRTERQLRGYTKQLERTNKELEEFSYVASHDLKEPVRNLISYSKLLEDDLGADLPVDAREDLGFIRDAARRMATLVDDLLHLSRAGRSALNFVELSLEDVLQDAIENLEVRIEETNTQIRFSHLPKVLGDKTLFLQLFSNLISNAIKFVEKGVDPKIEVGSESKGKFWLIWIKDNGIGMKEQYQNQIFLPFKRLHGMNKYEGTGIGLSICRKIVERHDGEIWVESQLGHGSTFFILLPKL